MKRPFALKAAALCSVVGLGLSITAFAASSLSMSVDCSGARFTGATDGDTVSVEVRLHQTADFSSPMLQNVSYSVTSTPFDIFVPWTDSDGDVDGQAYRVAIVVNGSVATVTEAHLDCQHTTGGEGCTPGYWKNHLDDWPATGYSPSDDFATIFGTDLGFSTLGDAVNARGGGSRRVARHGTAALLNAAHPSVDYPLTVAEVIAAVQSGDVDDLVDYNELGCDDL